MSVGARTPPSIAFMHIPKTAGSAIGVAFQEALGDDACRLHGPAMGEADFAGHRFIAGHLVLSTITDTAFRFTFLRDPIRQIASHLRWLDHYNDPALIEAKATFDEVTRAIFRRVGQTDFGSAAAIADFFAWLPGDAPVRLPNVQCQCLALRFDRQAYRGEAELAELAIANLALLDFVGIVERAEADLKRLFRRLDLGSPPVLGRHNTQSSRRTIDLADPAIRAVLAVQVRADLRLYAFAVRPWWWR